MPRSHLPCRRFHSRLALVLLITLLPSTALAATIYAPGDIIVAGPGTESDPTGRVVVLDPATSEIRTIAEGGLLEFPRGIAFAQDGAILATDLGGSSDRVIRIDPDTATQSLVAQLPTSNALEPLTDADVYR